MNPDITEEATRITAEIVPDDPERVSVYFKWNAGAYAHGAQASVVDGEVYLYLHLEDAHELIRKLDKALFTPKGNSDEEQDFADAGHPDPEEAMAEADNRREAMR